MEKIYIENNKQNNNKNFLHSKSVLGTFALAIIAVIAIVIVGVNQTSYAIPEVTNPLPDTFTTAVPGDRILTNKGFTVLPYKTTTGVTVFCMERDIDFSANTDFSKAEAITDYGLLYLMANISPNKVFKDSQGNSFNAEINDAVQTWVSQVAIWVYLHEINAANNSLDDATMEQIKNARTISTEKLATEYKVDGTKVDLIDNPLDETKDLTFYEEYIEPLVDAALEHKNMPNKILNINKTDTISVTSDEKYYQTSQISITATPDENFNGYSVKLEAAPEGSFIVDENGNKLEDDDLSDMSDTDKFYIRVPVDKVNENNKIIKFSVTGSFTTYEGNYYKATGAQTIGTVQTVTSNVQKGAEIPLNYTPDVPDTGLSTAQTVYFIGLIVLLSGIGIIYANVKPSESK